MKKFFGFTALSCILLSGCSDSIVDGVAEGVASTLVHVTEKSLEADALDSSLQFLGELNPNLMAYKNVGVTSRENNIFFEEIVEEYIDNTSWKIEGETLIVDGELANSQLLAEVLNDDGIIENTTPINVQFIFYRNFNISVSEDPLLQDNMEIVISGATYDSVTIKELSRWYIIEVYGYDPLED